MSDLPYVYFGDSLLIIPFYNIVWLILNFEIKKSYEKNILISNDIYLYRFNYYLWDNVNIKVKN